jgi:hypothetical protein
MNKPSELIKYATGNIKKENPIVLDLHGIIPNLKDNKKYDLYVSDNQNISFVRKELNKNQIYKDLYSFIMLAGLEAVSNCEISIREAQA